MDQVDEIKHRVPIEDLVSQYVKLKKTGRTYKGLCPFHNEKTPSFVVSPDKGIAYCFGCHQGGDVFSFIQLVERVDFTEAVKLLADKAGIKIKAFKKGGREKEKKVQNINEAACNFYIDQQSSHKKVQKYIQERNINDSTVKEFKIGFAPDSYDKTYSHLLKQGYSHKEILDAGLAIAKNLTELKIYDRFRNRIMFPIMNVQGQVIAFGGRALDNETQPKYLNSPESNYYNKSFSIFGLAQAKESIKKEDKVIIVEGYMDVIASHQAGIKNVVASSGTALTYAQVKLLKRYTRNFVFCFDSDKAGIEASKRALEISLPEEINIKMIQLNNVKDPDECIQKSVDEWKDSIENAKPCITRLSEIVFESHDKKNVDGQKAICNELLPLIKKIPNKVEQTFYLKNIAEYLKVSLQVLQSELLRMKSGISEGNNEKLVAQKTSYSREDYLIGIVLSKPEYMKYALDNLLKQILIDTKSKNVYNFLEKLYNLGEVDAPLDEIKDIEDNEKKRLKILTLYIEEKYQDFTNEKTKEEVLKIIKEINKKNYHLMKSKIIQDIKNTDIQKDEYKILLNKYNQMLKIKIS